MLCRRIVPVWRLRESITLVIVAACVLPLAIVWPILPHIILAVVAIVIEVLTVIGIPDLRYSRWRYEVADTDVRLRHGIFIVKSTVIPMVRVQHVEMSQGPIIKHFGMASVCISTAGGSFTIPGLELDEATRLRDQVAVLARIAQEDV